MSASAIGSRFLVWSIEVNTVVSVSLSRTYRPTPTSTTLAMNGTRQPHARNDSELMVNVVIRNVALASANAIDGPSCGNSANFPRDLVGAFSAVSSTAPAAIRLLMSEVTKMAYGGMWASGHVVLYSGRLAFEPDRLSLRLRSGDIATSIPFSDIRSIASRASIPMSYLDVTRTSGVVVMLKCYRVTTLLNALRSHVPRLNVLP